MPTSLHWSLSVLAALATLGPAEAAADDHVEITVVDDDDDDVDDAPPRTAPATTTTVTHEHEHDRHARTTWFGLSMGAVATPLGQDGRMRPGQRVTSDAFRACLDPFG